jgi:hypothetical protein
VGTWDEVSTGLTDDCVWGLRCYWRFLFSGIWRCVIGWVVTYVSKGPNAVIFRIIQFSASWDAWHLRRTIIFGNVANDSPRTELHIVRATDLLMIGPLIFIWKSDSKYRIKKKQISNTILIVLLIECGVCMCARVKWRHKERVLCANVGRLLFLTIAACHFTLAHLNYKISTCN